MMPHRFSLLLALGLSTVACAAAPPTGWQAGGTQLTVPRARWVAGDVLVDIDQEGHVAWGGKHVLTVDRAGRVYDAYNNPVALLESDGMVRGEDDKPMGWVGAGEAILPGDEHSWLRFDPTGLVLRVDEDGGQRPFGQWLGCNHPQVIQTCTLVTHLLGQELRERQRNRSRVGVGIGIGIGIGP
jgi:hypothetical protein